MPTYFLKINDVDLLLLINRAIEYSIYDFEIRKAETENEKLSKRREEINRDQNEVSFFSKLQSNLIFNHSTR